MRSLRMHSLCVLMIAFFASFQLLLAAIKKMNRVLLSLFFLPLWSTLHCVSLCRLSMCFVHSAKSWKVHLRCGSFYFNSMFTVMFVVPYVKWDVRFVCLCKLKVVTFGKNFWLSFCCSLSNGLLFSILFRETWTDSNRSSDNRGITERHCSRNACVHNESELEIERRISCRLNFHLND